SGRVVEEKGRRASRNRLQTTSLLDAQTGFANRGDDEPEFEATVRYRTVGDASCTGAVKSSALTLDEVIEEIAATRITERGQTRADDRTSEAAMEDRKKEGYF
ncbi:MAG: sulfate adenylyltransferase subunit CysD, partial [Spirillospora sp.]